MGLADERAAGCNCPKYVEEWRDESLEDTMLLANDAVHIVRSYSANLSLKEAKELVEALEYTI